MTDDQIHDLLDRAVRDHQPTTHEPWRSVVARARRRRRRHVALAAAGTLVAALGVTTVIGVGGPGSGISPAQSGTGTALMPSVEQGDGSVVYESAEGNIRLWDDGLVVTPEDWVDLPAADAGQNDRESYECPDRGQVIYRSTVFGAADSIEVPCIGTTTTPYVWQQDIQTPSLNADIEQTVLPTGTVQWVVQLADDSAGEPTYAVIYPNLGQTVVSRGVERAELLAMLAPPAPHTASFGVPATSGTLLGRVLRVGSTYADLDLADSRELWAALAADAAVLTEPGSCAPLTGQFHLSWDGGFLLATEVDGCATAVSSLGAAVRLSPETVTLIDTLAG